MQSPPERVLPPDSRRIRPVRVADIPLPTRRSAAAACARIEPDPYEALKIKLFAEDPGDYVAWVAA
jgi:hypothetical protein